MSQGKFEIDTANERVIDLAERLSKERIIGAHRVCERYGESEEDVRQYDVYRVETPSGSKLLKRAGDREIANYERYLTCLCLSTPGYYGHVCDEGESWMLVEYIAGDDLREMTDELAVLAAESLSGIQNAYWAADSARDHDRFDAYWQRINKRFQYIKREPEIARAYELFLKRQLSCPRTLSNGDFMQLNAVCSGRKVYVIDWGFGGLMPYSLDIARFIAHGTEERATFPIYMNQGQKDLFVKAVYERLNSKPEYAQYLYDIKLALLNEYVEFMEADEDESGWYAAHAAQLAKRILA